VPDELAIRPAIVADVPAIVALQIQGAQARARHDTKLWAVAPDAAERIRAGLTGAIDGSDTRVHQTWQVAQQGDQIVGVAHGMRLPVPPIYAGRFGAPGLLMPDCVVANHAMPGTHDALVAAVEQNLIASGAKLLLSSFVTGGDWRSCFEARGYEPLTLYFAKSGLTMTDQSASIRPAAEDDVPAIVARSAEHRAIIAGLSDFWETHPDADARFDPWMRKSQGFADRDMIVDGSPGDVRGYVIAQPASGLHFPPAHYPADIGFIDDFFHAGYVDVEQPDDSESAAELLGAAENAFVRRGVDSVFVVCPAMWSSKASVLKNAGYAVAMTWMRKR